MDITDWRLKFYPTDASLSTATEEEAIRHCIRKWEGLRRPVLEEYGLEALLRGGDLSDGSGKIVFGMGAASCALCRRHSETSDIQYTEIRCEECSLFAVRGEPCCESARSPNSSPYDRWLRFADPEPMLVLLNQALEHEAETGGEAPQGTEASAHQFLECWSRDGDAEP